MRILWLSRWFPYPPDNGAKIRAFNLIKHLARENSVDLISFTSEEPDPVSLQTLKSYCNRIEYTPYSPFRPNSIKSALAFFSPTPRSIIDTHSPVLQTMVEEACQANKYDVIIAREFEMAHYALKDPAPVRIFEEIELSRFYDPFEAEKDPVRKFRKGLTWWKMSRYHRSILEQFSGGTAVSERERAIVSEKVTAKSPIQVIPNGVDVDFYAGDFGMVQPNSLIYTGALTYRANYDAVLFFLKDIFPIIQRQNPLVQFKITGKYNGVDLSALPANEHVSMTGFLPDIRPTLKQSSVCVIPLREGGGTRLKILEALAAGVPVVTTTKGMEGLNLTPQHDLLVADRPDDFAHCVLQLLGDPILCRQLIKNGLETVNRLYNWNAIARTLDTFISDLVGKRS